MGIFDSLSPQEQARQLANPSGTVGIEIAAWLNENNREGNARALEQLDVRPGHRVLEIGFGNGAAAAAAIALAPGVRYDGIDISPTMLVEAERANRRWIQAGLASFHLADAARMPFGDALFDRVFAIGVAHFWKDALTPLRELHRVLRPGGFAICGGVDPQEPPPFARAEFGFWLRTPDEWEALCREAGFGAVEAWSVPVQAKPGGAGIRRRVVRFKATR